MASQRLFTDFVSKCANGILFCLTGQHHRGDADHPPELYCARWFTHNTAAKNRVYYSSRYLRCAAQPPNGANQRERLWAGWGSATGRQWRTPTSESSLLSSPRLWWWLLEGCNTVEQPFTQHAITRLRVEELTDHSPVYREEKQMERIYDRCSI